MAIVQVLLVTRSPFYADVLSRILTRDRNIRLNVAPEFMLALPPNSAAGASWIVIYDLDSTHLTFDAYMNQIASRPHRPKVLLYQDNLVEDDLLYYLSRGTHGCIQASKVNTLLLPVLKHIASGGVWFPHKVIARFIERVVCEMSQVCRLFQSHPLVSKRECEVWALISSGASNKEIASRLLISERTVKFHVSHLFEKLDASNRRELMVLFGQNEPQFGSEQTLKSSMGRGSGSSEVGFGARLSGGKTSVNRNTLPGQIARVF